MARKPKRRGPSPVALGALLVVAGLGVWGMVAAIMGASPSPDGVSESASIAPSAAPVGSLHFPNEWPNPPPADIATLLGGLGPGSSLDGGWRVRGVSPAREKRVIVDVERGEIGFRVWITRKGAGPGAPPKETEKYALYTVQPRPLQNSVPNEEFGRVLESIANRIAGQETRVPTPAGL